MAKIVLKQKLKKAGVTYIKVFSAGFSCLDGEPMTKESEIALKKLGYKKEKHLSTNLKTLNLNDYKIFALTEAHKEALGGRCQSAKDLLGYDILDPWHMPQEIYDNCAEQIEKFCDAVMVQVVTVEVKK